MGLPPIAAAFGSGAAIAMALGLPLEVVVMTPLAIVILKDGKDPEKSLSELASPLVKNPLIRLQAFPTSRSGAT